VVNRNKSSLNDEHARLGNHVEGLPRNPSENWKSFQRLNPGYSIQHQLREFFKVGRVLKIAWPELDPRLDNNSSSIIIVHGQSISVKNRWFVVIREGTASCTCL
jgi:hypothetical protein